MIKLKNYLVYLLGGFSFMVSLHATPKDFNAHALMTVRDLQGPDLSNITLTNHTGKPITVSGLFIASFDVNDCSSCYGSVVAGDNLGGAVVTPTTFNTNQSLPLGGNYLYNMIYSGIFYITNSVGSSPCLLPGCTWPGDNPFIKGWCITINVVSPNSSYTYSNYKTGSNPPANAPAYSQAGNSTPYNYKYDLIDPTTLGSGKACLGPIVCNDKTLTCHVATAQNESFQPY